MKYPIHEDFRSIAISVSLHPVLLPPEQAVTRLLHRSYPCEKDIDYSRDKVPAYEGKPVSVGIYRPKTALPAAGDRPKSSETLPALLFIHGGGFALPAVDYHREILQDYVRSGPCVGIDLDYHLLPANPYPAGLEDCYAVYHWIRENADNLGIDPSRIALCGDSAGAALAAGLAQKLRDKDALTPLFQMLVCPVLDARMQTPSMMAYDDTPVWNAKTNRTMWSMYLKNIDDVEDPVYASPGTHPSVEGLPPAYIEVSEFDCLRDEGLAYARRLEEAGIPVVLNETKGTIHGYELAKKSPYRNELLAKRREYLVERFTPDSTSP